MEKDFEALQLAKECLTESGKLYQEKNLSEATTLLLRAKDIFLENEEYDEYLRALRELSFIYFALGRDNEEIECYVDGIKCAHEKKFYDILVSFYVNFGNKFQSLNDYETAMELYEKARETRKLIPGEFAKENMYKLVLGMNMTTIYLKREDFENARKTLDTVIEAATEIDDPDFRVSYMCFENYALWHLGEQEKVKANLDNIVETVKSCSFITDYNEMMENVCNLLRDMQEFDKLCDVLQSMERFMTTEDYTYRLLMCEYWQEYFLLIGNHEAYSRKCIEFSEITKEKATAENKARAEMISILFKDRIAAKNLANNEDKLYRDPLTGIFNRNKMLEDSIEDIAVSKKNQTFITIGLIDVDFFKLCNDTYGHIKGDECLRSVAKVIQEEVRSLGRVYRFGGDEFLILLNRAQKSKEVLDMAQRIKERIEELNIPNVQSSIADYVTVSQGYTMAVADDEKDKIEDLIQKADKVLYEVKRSGRNNYLYKKFFDI